MTPRAIIALVKDLVIIAAVACTLYFVMNYGEDFVKLKDVQALQLQLKDNATAEARWRQEQVNADTDKEATLSRLALAIGSQRAPVYVLRGGSPSAGPVPGAPAPAGGEPARPGGTHAGSRGDLEPLDQRPAVNAYEIKYEGALADCRAGLAKWPRP